MNQIASYELLQDVLKIPRAGFEPALPKETDLKSVALDHSANPSLIRILNKFIINWYFFAGCILVPSHTQSNKSGGKIQIFSGLFDLITYLYGTISLSSLINK